MTAPALRVWQGIESEHPPFARDDYPNLLAMAESMLEARRKRFPVLIERNLLDRAAAQAELDTFAAIVADWRWIISGEGEPAGADTLDARRDALDESLRTIAAIAREQGGFPPDLADQVHRVIALRWHLEPESGVHALARSTHALRRPFQQQRRADHAG